MTSINPNKEIVKRKIKKSEVGEEPCWQCVEQLSQPANREDFSTSVDINPQKRSKNAVGTILTSLKGGSDDSLGSKKLEFLGNGGAGDSPLLDSLYSIISRYVYITGLYR